MRRAPGPPTRPLVGNVPEILRSDTRLQTFLAWHRAYGDCYQFRLGRQVEHAIADPDAIKRVLQENATNYPKGPHYDRARPVLGNGLATSSGETWLRQRRMMQPSFHLRALAKLADTMTATIADWADEQATDTTVDVAADMMDLTLRIVGQTLLGSDMKEVGRWLGPVVGTVLEGTQRRVFAPTDVPLWWPTPRNLAFRQALGQLNDVVLGVIQDHHERDGTDNDLLSVMTGMRDEATGEGMSDVQLRDEVMTLMLAGHETTASALAWAWYLLSTHPQVARRFRAELAEVLGDRLPTFDDLPRLTYTTMVLQETLRLYPTLPAIQRRAVAADTLCGFDVPAGSLVGIYVFVLHRHPDLWENPAGFDPERFLPDQVAARHPFAYLPFGAGPRQCIGNHFAMMEAKLVLAVLGQRFRLDAVPGHPVVPAFNMTLRAQHGIQMRRLVSS